jgi:hypothetical protein
MGELMLESVLKKNARLNYSNIQILWELIIIAERKKMEDIPPQLQAEEVGHSATGQCRYKL